MVPNVPAGTSGLVMRVVTSSPTLNRVLTLFMFLFRSTAYCRSITIHHVAYQESIDARPSPHATSSTPGSRDGRCCPTKIRAFLEYRRWALPASYHGASYIGASRPHGRVIAL